MKTASHKASTGIDQGGTFPSPLGRAELDRASPHRALPARDQSGSGIGSGSGSGIGIGIGIGSGSGSGFGHGKVILLGEHAVVYGHPALAGALSEGVTVHTRVGRGRLRMPAWSLEFDPSEVHDERPLARSYRALRESLGLRAESPADFEVHFAVPTGAGLGSSAAMAVALARALCACHGRAADRQAVLDAAMASETVMHGRPSGLDHTLAAEGGFGIFTKRGGLALLVATRPLQILVGHTGRERDTKSRVSRVAELYAERESEVRRRLLAIETLVERGRTAVEDGSDELLGEAMNENQAHLEALEVSCPEIERMCAIARGSGALGAKLTGGGGGGCVIALAPNREADVLDAWERAGFRGFRATVGGQA